MRVLLLLSAAGLSLSPGMDGAVGVRPGSDCSLVVPVSRDPRPGPSPRCPGLFFPPLLPFFQEVRCPPSTSCSLDARILPSRILGLEEGDAHVVRNAGGRARDALRSLIISQRLLGTREVAVIHHTDCGMLTFSNRDLRQKVKDDLGSDTGEFDFLPFQDLDESVREDVEFLQATQLLDPDRRSGNSSTTCGWGG